MFLGSFILFKFFASSYIPLFFGKKIESTIVGIDSSVHKSRYSYFAVMAYSEKKINEKELISDLTSQKRNIKIGQKKDIYYLEGYGIIDPNMSFLLPNAMTLTSFLICFMIGIAFYKYIKGEI